MIALDLAHAAELINEGRAGFYAYRCQAPIAHNSQMCVFADGGWWLLTNGTLRVIDKGIYVDGTSTWARWIELDVDETHPIVELLLRDEKNHRGPDTPEPVANLYLSMLQARRE